MTRCLQEKELVLLHAGDGRPGDRDHLETCPGCAGRYRQLADDLRVIGAVLASDPAPVAAAGRTTWPRWVAAAAVTFALVLGLNLLFAREWGWLPTRQSPEPAGGGTATEELIAAVEAMSTDEPSATEAPEPPAPPARGSSTLEASVAELYATVAGAEACESPAPGLEEGCDQAPAPEDPLGAGVAGLDS